MPDMICLNCGSNLPAKRSTRRKFCSAECRFAFHSAQRRRSLNKGTGSYALEALGPDVQALWNDLHAVFRKHAPAIRRLLDAERGSTTEA
jgi:hypothetical protein